MLEIKNRILEERNFHLLLINNYLNNISTLKSVYAEIHKYLSITSE